MAFKKFNLGNDQVLWILKTKWWPTFWYLLYWSVQPDPFERGLTWCQTYNFSWQLLHSNLDCMLNPYLHWYQTICVTIVCIWLGKEMVTKANKLLYILRGRLHLFSFMSQNLCVPFCRVPLDVGDGEQQGASRSWWDSLCLHPTVISIDSSVLLSPCL